MNLPFNKPQSWKEKTLDADKIWAQISQLLQSKGLTLPQTLRRPDVRLILDNVSGTDKIFRNPGDHSNKAEKIPSSGDKTAAMVMVHGDTLATQYQNAATLVKRYKLDQQGLSDSFVQALSDGTALDLVREAYGPAPFTAQSDKLVDVTWEHQNGQKDDITPVRHKACSYGARAAAGEMAFLTEIVVFIKGTGTTPEQVESTGMVIVVSEDWETKAISTRPIVPSVAKEFYGKHFDAIPVVDVHPDGFVQKIDCKDGTVIDMSATGPGDYKKFTGPR